MPSVGTRYVSVCEVDGDPMLRATLKGRVAELMDTEFCARHIARSIGANLEMVTKLIKEIDNETSEEVRESPLAVRGKYRRGYLYAFNELLEKSKQKICVRDDDGNVVKDENGKYIKTDRGFSDKERLQWLKLIDLLSQLDEGVKAPTKNVTMGLHAHSHSIVSADQQEALFNDPEYRALILAAEERERQLAAQGAGHVPRAIRDQSGDDAGWTVDVATASGTDERYAPGHAGEEGFSTVDDGAATNRKVPILEQAGPGLHPRSSPELEDHLG